MQHNQVIVSVVIVNYKAYAELAACLDSLQPFMTGETEAVVVDHASEPGQAARIKQAFLWAQVLDVPENPGFAAGVNRAARTARGEYLLLLNPDCVVDADVAGTLARWLDGNPRVGACGALVRESDGTVQQSARRFPDVTAGFAGRTTWLTRLWPGNPWTKRNLVAEQAREPMEVDWVSGACTMIRRDAFDAVGGMDEGFFLYWEDADLCYRLQQAGWSTVYYPGVGVTHLTGRSSLHARERSLVAFHRSAFRYFQKHAGPLSRAASPFVFIALQLRLYAKLLQLRFSRRGSG